MSLWMIIPGGSGVPTAAASRNQKVHFQEIEQLAIGGKVQRSHIKGPVNGGGKPVILRTSGGSVHIVKS